MDRTLAERLNALHKQNETLRKAREAYLLKEASRKHFEATLIRQAEGKSQAEKLINAQSKKEWLEFSKELAALESVFEFERLKWELLDKAYLAEHLSYKLDGDTIKRG
jgi:hypothetical protein